MPMSGPGSCLTGERNAGCRLCGGPSRAASFPDAASCNMHVNAFFTLPGSVPGLELSLGLGKVYVQVGQVSPVLTGAFQEAILCAAHPRATICGMCSSRPGPSLSYLFPETLDSVTCATPRSGVRLSSWTIVTGGHGGHGDRDQVCRYVPLPSLAPSDIPLQLPTPISGSRLEDLSPRHK